MRLLHSTSLAALLTLAPAALTAQLNPRAPAPSPRVSAEHFFRPGSVALSVFAGGAAFSAFQQSSVQPAAAGGAFERRLSAHTSTALGGELVWWLTPALGMRLHGSWLPTRFDVQLDAAGREYVRMRMQEPDSMEWRALHVWLADASVLLRPPFTLGRLAPYAVLGGGVVSYRPRGERALPPDAAATFRNGARTAPAAVVGVGAAVPLQRNDLILSFALTNHITRTPLEPAGQPLGTVLEHDLIAGESGEPADEVSLTSNVRLLVGLTIPLRRPR